MVLARWSWPRIGRAHRVEERMIVFRRVDRTDEWRLMMSDSLQKVMSLVILDLHGEFRMTYLGLFVLNFESCCSSVDRELHGEESSISFAIRFCIHTVRSCCVASICHRRIHRNVHTDRCQHWQSQATDVFSLPRRTADSCWFSLTNEQDCPSGDTPPDRRRQRPELSTMRRGYRQDNGTRTTTRNPSFSDCRDKCKRADDNNTIVLILRHR